MKSQLAQLLASASLASAQIAAKPPTGEQYSPIPLKTLSQNSTSVNIATYQTDTSLYYLGYDGVDWSRPFAKYWQPAEEAISEEAAKGITESPFASRLVYKPHEAPQYFTQPGYLGLENGWAVDDDGMLMISIRTDMNNVTGDMYDWWFGWHLVDSQRYKLWHPLAHQYAYRVPNTVDFSNKTLPERYIGTYSWIDEYLGNNATKLTINFVDPTSVGFNTSAFDSQGIETIVTARINNGHTTNVTGNSYLMHQIRRKDDGTRELRSRFFFDVYTDNMAHDLAVHCAVEMSHLATFLPELHAEFKDTV
ncbi:hypothetical protein LX36DRAFT_715245 [Colletotrichum falcatum]|nr:hypothetical protein LX36DRAFT_715245 [Colletotrichum falcatum]